MERINPFARALRAKYMAFVWLLCALIGAELVQAQDGFSRRFQHLRYTADSTCFWITTTRDTICFPAGGAPDSLLIYLNGLTKSSDTVRLGGVLTDSTGIYLNGHPFTISGPGVYYRDIWRPGHHWRDIYLSYPLFGSLRNQFNPSNNWSIYSRTGDLSSLGFSNHGAFYGLINLSGMPYGQAAVVLETDTASGNMYLRLNSVGVTGSPAIIEIGTKNPAGTKGGTIILGTPDGINERGILIDYEELSVGRFEPVYQHYYSFPYDSGYHGQYMIFDTATLSLEFLHLTYLPMDSTQRNALTPNTGMGIFCTDCPAGDATVGVAQVFNGTAWRRLW